MRFASLLVLTALAAAATSLSAGCERDDAQLAGATVASSTTSAVGGQGGAGQGGLGSGGSGQGAGGDAAGGSGGEATGGGGMGISTCGIGLQPGVGGGSAGTSGRVRVVAANLSSGNNQSYDLGHGIRILQGLDAEVVLLQEMNFGNNSEAAIDTLVDDACEGECNYIRGPQAQIPNGVLSRLPILECGSWVDPEVNNRNFVWARIDAPGEADLWAISVHFLSSGATKRAAEAAALLDEIAQAIPANDMIVLGGDLNTNSRTETAVGTLSSIFETSGPFPVDHNGNANTNTPRSKPYDWVLADAQLSTMTITTTIGNSMFPSGAVVDTRVYMPLSEIAPAQVNDSEAPSMQHMAVVRDFQIDP